MLLIAAALLLTASMHSSGVVEAPAVPGPESHVLDAAAHGVLHVTGTDADRGHADPDRLAVAQGAAFLDALGTAGPGDLARADSDERVLATAQDRPPTAISVARWWGALSAATRERLIASAPAVVGNLDGVPYDVRDRANRTTLDAGLTDDATAGAESGPTTARTAMLEQVRDALHQEPGEGPRHLVVLDTRGTGRAAVAIGDLASARDVSVVVPGMFFTVTGQMHDFTDTASDLYDEQTAVSALAEARTGRGAPASGHGDGDGSTGVTTGGTAVLAWMGYRTPDMSNILSLGLARTGADRLERVVDGLDAVRGADRPRLNVVAHSYGSTTALMALSSGHMRADSLTVLGSPGSEVQSAAELAVRTGQVYVGDAHSDPIAGSGYFGTDPGSAGFGSTVLDLSADTAGVDTGLFRRPVGHNDYLKPGTASLHDVALIGIGRGDLVRHQARRGQGGDGTAQPLPDMYLLRPQDLQPRD